jgi:RHS repeat-associated protein
VGYVLSDNNGDGNMYLYDAEGRICAVQTPAADGIVIKTGYVYDAEGRRVAKGTITSWSCDPSVNGLSAAVNETDYILDQSDHQVTEMASDANGSMAWSHTNVWAGGQLLATYSAILDANNQPDGALHFYLNDWLGTRRVQTDYAGVLEQTCSSLPFGDGLNCTQSMQFPTEHHFTGKERDQESGNDYFGARYYASSMARFLSPDWSKNPQGVPYADYTNPQTLNLYQYMRNNPLGGEDPDGRDPTLLDQEFANQVAAAGIQGQGQSAPPAQQPEQDPTLPTAVDPPPPSLLDRLLPQSPGDGINLAIMAGTDGLGEVPEVGTKLLSSIGEDAKLVKYAEEAGKSVQKGLDSLTEALSKGNTNPGIGTKGLGKGISYARARDGARVFFRQAGNQIEILAKASKANESQVINYLKSLYF